MSCATKGWKLIGASFGGTEFEFALDAAYSTSVQWAKGNDYGPEVVTTCRQVAKFDVHGMVVYQGLATPLTPNSEIGDFSISVQSYDNDATFTIICANMTPGQSSGSYSAQGPTTNTQEFDYVAEEEGAMDSVTVGS